jgi:hypothetical protein
MREKRCDSNGSATVEAIKTRTINDVANSLEPPNQTLPLFPGLIHFFSRVKRSPKPLPAARSTWPLVSQIRTPQRQRHTIRSLPRVVRNLNLKNTRR